MTSFSSNSMYFCASTCNVERGARLAWRMEPVAHMSQIGERGARQWSEAKERGKRSEERGAREKSEKSGEMMRTAMMMVMMVMVVMGDDDG